MACHPILELSSQTYINSWSLDTEWNAHQVVLQKFLPSSRGIYRKVVTRIHMIFYKRALLATPKL